MVAAGLGTPKGQRRPTKDESIKKLETDAERKASMRCSYQPVHHSRIHLCFYCESTEVEARSRSYQHSSLILNYSQATRGAASIIVMRRIPCVALAVILLACSCHARVVGGERRVQAQSQDMESDEVEVCGPPNTEFSSIAAQEFNFYSDPLRLDGQFLSLASLPSK